jgi:c-di-GMP-binding flagellar brake protein YcgR
VIEHRSSTRHQVNIPVQITHAGETIEQTLFNISLGGAMFSFADRLPLGTSLTIEFRIPTQEAAISTDCQVRWCSDEVVGVQFNGLRAREVWSLTEYFKQLGIE